MKRIALTILVFTIATPVFAITYYYFTRFSPYQAGVIEIISTTSGEHRELPRPAYDLAKIAEGESGLTHWVAWHLLKDRNLGREPDRKMANWHFHFAMWSKLIKLKYTEEELFALWCNYYFNFSPTGEFVKGLNDSAKEIFGGSLSELSVEETAELIGALKSPKIYMERPEELKKRIEWILNQYET